MIHLNAALFDPQMTPLPLLAFWVFSMKTQEKSYSPRIVAAMYEACNQLPWWMELRWQDTHWCGARWSMGMISFIRSCKPQRCAYAAWHVPWPSACAKCCMLIGYFNKSLNFQKNRFQKECSCRLFWINYAKHNGLKKSEVIVSTKSPSLDPRICQHNVIRGAKSKWSNEFCTWVAALMAYRTLFSTTVQIAVVFLFSSRLQDSKGRSCRKETHFACHL